MYYPIPANETDRLADLYQLDIPNKQEDELNGLVELIATITGCPISLISIVDKEHQWFKAKKGFDETGTDRSQSFCSHTILQDDLFIVEDARSDERFWDNTLVTGPMKVRFYAGVPFKSPSGNNIGAVCVLDRKVRKLTFSQRKALQVVADKVGELLWLRKAQKQSIKQVEETRLLLQKEAIAQQVIHSEALHRIGYELHEDYAQSIAACLQFLESAKRSTSLEESAMESTKQVLKDVLWKMRQLASEINPSHLTFMSK